MSRDSKGNLEFFYGPISKPEAEEIVEYLLDTKGLYEDLVALLMHDLAPGELEYRVQVMAESRDEFLEQCRKEDGRDYA